MDFSSKDTELDKMLDDVLNGDLALPEFQRDFVWRPNQVLDLVRSIAKRWPTGSFLVLEGDRTRFKPRAIESAPGLRKNPRFLLLDGQQRVTSALHAFTDRSDDVYYVDLSDTTEDDDDRFCHCTRRRASTLMRRESITIADFRDDASFFKWVGKQTESVAERAHQLRQHDWSGLRRNVYRMPATYLREDTPIEAIAKIFETVNKSGVRLDTFDLMTAATYDPKSGFNLRDEWKTTRSYQPLFDVFSVSGVEILRMIALLERVQGRSQSGVRQSDVLKLASTVVRARWKDAVDFYATAIEFARAQGSVGSVLVPSTTMLLGAGGMFSAGMNLDEVQRWWWKSTLEQRYAQGGNTLVLADLRDPFSVIASRVVAPSAEDLLEPIRRNQALLSGCLSLLVSNGAINPIDGKVLREDDEGVLQYGVVPIWKGFAAWSEPLANFTVVRGTDSQIRRLARVGLDQSGLALDGHCVPQRRAGFDIETAVRVRAESLARTVRTFLETSQ